MSPAIYACGSNSGGQLSISHKEDVALLTKCEFHPSISPLLSGSHVVDLASAASHSLLLVTIRIGDQPRNILLGAGTNSYGQLGPRCALWDDVKPETRFKQVDLLGPLGISHDDWEPIKIALTWTTSFVVYRELGSVSETTSSNSSSAAAPLRRQIVISTGSNDFGELGSSELAPSDLPTSMPSSKPTIVDLGLSNGEWVEHIKGGRRHIMVVTAQGSGSSRRQRILGWGAARKGELDLAKSIPTESTNRLSSSKGKGKAVSLPRSIPPTEIPLDLPPGVLITSIALGASHTLALLSSGHVLSCGSDAKSQISNLDQLENVNSIAASWGGSYFIVETPSERQILSQGSNSHFQLLRASEEIRGELEISTGEVDRIVSGSEHLLAIASKAGGKKLLVGGWNEHGNLGLGDQRDRSALTEVEGGVLSGKEIKRIWGGCAATWVELQSS